MNLIFNGIKDGGRYGYGYGYTDDDNKVAKKGIFGFMKKMG